MNEDWIDREYESEIERICKKSLDLGSDIDNDIDFDGLSYHEASKIIYNSELNERNKELNKKVNKEIKISCGIFGFGSAFLMVGLYNENNHSESLGIKSNNMGGIVSEPNPYLTLGSFAIGASLLIYGSLRFAKTSFNYLVNRNA